MTTPLARLRRRPAPVLALSAALAASTLVVGAGAGAQEGTASPTSASAAVAVVAAPVALHRSLATTSTTAAAPDRKKTTTSRATVRVSASPFKFASSNFNKWYAKRYMKVRYGWQKAQYRCLAPLWGRESAWNERAHNSSSGAHGIPQAMPGSKMASFGRDWRTDPVTQIKWGLSYIKGVYDTPCRAWSHWKSRHWY